MSPSHYRLHGREDASPDPNAVGPGQRISVDGGIESRRGIIAVILAIALFILVVILYHFLTVEIARREEEEAEARKSGKLKHKREKSTSEGTIEIIRTTSELLKRCISYLKRITSTPKRRSFNGSGSHISMEALLKVKPKRAPQEKSTLNLPCLGRQKGSKSKTEARRIPRPLLLNRGAGYATYTPRSPLDVETKDMLRSPDAFAEYSDPVRNMNFVRTQDEVQRRKERDEVWFETPSDGPGKPGAACVAPLAFRTKPKQGGLLREGDANDNDWAPPSPEHVMCPARQEAEPFTPASHSSWGPHSSSSSLLPYSPRCQPTISEKAEPSTPHSFFDIGEDEGKSHIHRRKFSLRFPIPPQNEGSRVTDADVFSIGSFSVSSDGSGH